MEDDTYTYQLSTGFSIYVEMARQLDSMGRKPVKGSRFHVLLGDRFGIKYGQLLGKEAIGVEQCVNYFPKTHLLTLKTALVRRLREQGKNPNWLPESYILMKETNEQALDETAPPWKKNRNTSKDAQEAEHDKARFAAIPKGDKVWILKPSSACGGQGIHITNDPKEAVEIVEKANGKGLFVAQQYIDKPLLLEGERKFDMRCWVLLTWDFKVHLFTEGSLRTSSSTYNSDYKDLPAHVTNHCLQETQEGFGKFEEGNEMWYSVFEAFLSQHHPTRSLEADVLPQVREIILTTLDSVRELLSVDGTSQYLPFQLFGYDFLVDSAFKVWLLEINGSPASAEKFKSEMVADILRKTVHRQFPFMPAEIPDGTPHFELIN
eukprot:TRINITY_DN13519_c0_g3_i1.p1 TRINITY_DN13519_c0_g3~~TRINITY_DN13519_c0_g3_i1.p1  ORF type:complete len:377 (+),score=76.91 TRINITY_DN13519_c0_g3_i1:62-1192(+)